MGGDAHSDSSTGAGGSAPDGNKRLSELQEQLAGMREALAAEKAAREAVQGQLNQLLTDPRYISAISGEPGEAGEGESDPPTGKGALDWDSLSMSEAAAQMEKRFAERLEAALSKHGDRVGGIEESVGRLSSVTDLALALVQNPEMGARLKDEGFRKRFMAASKENPNWTSARAYQEVNRAEKLERFEQVEARRKEAEAARDAATEGRGLPASLSIPDDLTDFQAAEMAARTILGDLPDETTDLPGMD